MRAPTALLLAALAVLVVLVAYFVAKEPGWALGGGPRLAGSAESPWEVYRRSDGTFDDAARLALRRAAGKADPTPGEHLLSATIITRNILGQEHRPERARTGEPTPAAVERARLRRGMFDRARGHYVAALEGLRQRAEELRAERLSRRAAPPRAEAWDPDAERVLAAALEFAFGGVAGLLANDATLAALAAERWDFPVEVVVTRRGPLLVDRPLAAEAGRLQQELLEERRGAAHQAAAAQGGARGAAVDAYVALATQHTDDPQNVHDTGVLACMRATLGRLRDDQGPLDALPSLGEIAAAIRRDGEALSGGRPALVEDAVAVVERARAGERVVAIDATDEECLRRAWARADDPRNAAARGALRQAVFDGLVDSWENGLLGRKITCVNGRAERPLGALVLLDWDRRNWVVKKLEQFKNDVFELARGAIRGAAQRAAESADPGRQKAGRLYLAQTAAEVAAVGAVPEEAAEGLNAEMRRAVEAAVDGYLAELEGAVGAKDAIPEYQVAAVKMEALAAID